jgi:hypothetical protein
MSDIIETKVGPDSEEFPYKVSNLEQLADFFETLGSDQEASVRWQSRQKDKIECLTKAAVWRDAASILRNTIIIDNVRSFPCRR